MLTRSPPQFYRVTSAKRRLELEVGSPLVDHGGRRHRLYAEVAGNLDGPVVLCLHGGPGAGSNPATRQFFDPDHYCIVQFDQRGAGRSTPWACMEQNNTPALVEDIEALAQHLALDRFILFGGSWGSTLALAYVNAYPHRVSAMVLRGIFLGRPRDIDWFLWGMQGVMPEAHHQLLAHLAPHERTSASTVLQAYARRLNSQDPLTANQAAFAWASYEDAAATLKDNGARVRATKAFERRRSALASGQASSPAGSAQASGQHEHREHSNWALSIARAEATYLANDLFLAPQGLLANAAKWSHIPGNIVHGRFDMVCQVEGAYQLATAWPTASLKIVDDAGHSTFEDGIARALLSSMEELKRLPR